ncbi:hypothetical protein I7I48_10767 [Histoplasma ohiense]|nr:hypothetical protein I7I48_10767 [Histoplasma ohiense (nom. inval.)]
MFTGKNVQTRAGHWNLRGEVERTSRSGSSSSSSSSSSSRDSERDRESRGKRIVDIVNIVRLLILISVLSSIGEHSHLIQNFTCLCCNVEGILIHLICCVCQVCYCLVLIFHMMVDCHQNFMLDCQSELFNCQFLLLNC